jgi:peptidoglycan/LPS O-acetylase OafA/YrhL
VCLIVTAFGFATLAWLHSDHGSAWTYLTAPGGPIGFVTHNFFLKMDQLTIRGTLQSVPWAPVWNGSLWTLFFEFLCYLILGVLALLGLMRHRAVVAFLALAVWITEIIVTSVPNLNAQVGHLRNTNLMDLLELVPIFLMGAVVYLYRDKVPDSGWVAIGSAILILSGWAIPLGSDVPGATLTSVDLTAVFIVLPLLWLGTHLPCQRIGAVNDYSYGIYIYAFPIQQLLALWGVTHWGFVPYTALTIAITACAAMVSWWVIEKRALRLRSWTPRSSWARLAHDVP